MSNVISNFSVDELLSKAVGKLSTLGAIRYLGHPDKAAADPDTLVMTSRGRQIVAYAGAAEVAVSDPGGNYFKTIAVGHRPTALVLSSDEKHLYVASTLSDEISVIDVDKQKSVAQILLGPTPRLSLAEQGELLFHDARLASDGWYSCHSCHTDGHSNGGLNDNFGDDSYGAPKRVLSLLGVADTKPWTWSGEAENLASQIRKSIEVTMQGPKPSDHQVQALEAYIRTLVPPPSLTAARQVDDNLTIERGRRLFTSLNCADCHQPSTYTSTDAYDIGLRDELGHTKFNPPSLRGVSQRHRLFHDNRATNLRAVFEKHGHQLDRKLTRDELDTLLSFLNSL
jgi:YVTN family beta-propeller protein